MALNMVDPSNFEDGEDALGTEVRAEILNILNNPISLISPFTGDVDGGNKNITGVAGIGVGQAVVFADTAANPTAAGQLMRNGTILKFHDGSSVRVNQCVQALGQSGIITNTAVESAVYFYDVPAGALGTLNKVRINMLFRLGLLSGASATVLTYYGGSPGPTIGIGNLSASTAGLTLIPLVITLSANTANSQNLVIEGNMSRDANNAADPFASLCPNLAQSVPLVVNSAIAQTLAVNVLFSAADLANQCDYLGLTTTLVG